ncbi:hypothetical protein C900_00310 [Fulvivirga imtechensis AK7]|uniref:Uncharacterized protein n=1 Tax=Fulvivirga imtechensis AK7 TaxID=1237149 RepID=L8JHY0_9BACT|nr:hypothetical protein [Fulvivirga imtechensis]ELR68476.1 hypothetical protein C900_00310 [Fulvivirga imtechensis AK7]
MKVPRVKLPGARGQEEITHVSLWIDTYDDIFSGFDPRSFSERALSDDFIMQVRKVSKEIRTKISVLKLLVPAGTQHTEHERMIRKRLQNYFYNMYQQLYEEYRSVKVRGVYFTISGLSLMIIASYLSYLNLADFYTSLLLVLSEPGGWFLFWTGLDHLVTFSRSQKNEMDFYTRMSNVHVEFGAYGSGSQ